MNNKPALVSIIVIAVVLLAIIYKVHADRHVAHTLSPPAAAISLPPAQASVPVPILHRVIYTLSQNSHADDNGLVAHTIALTHPESPARDALNALASAPTTPLPPGTTLRGITIRDGLATADFSSQFKANFPGGDTREAQVISAIRQTLGQFPEIQNVQILVDGKPIDTLGGMLDLSVPLPVIRPQDTKTARGIGTE